MKKSAWVVRLSKRIFFIVCFIFLGILNQNYKV